MRHLDDLLFRQLQSQPAAVPAEVWAHLRSDCPLCARYLEERAAADAVDGQVDAALLGAPEAPAPAGELEAILDRAARPRRRALPLVAALACAALAGALALRGPARPPDDGTKGPAEPPTISAAFAVVGPDRRVAAGVPGGAYRADEVLSLRLELSRPARVSLVRRDAAGAEVLLLNQPAPAGRSDLRRGQELVGVPLAGLAGEEELKVVAAERELSEAEARSAAAGAEVAGARVTGFTVRVAP